MTCHPLCTRCESLGTGACRNDNLRDHLHSYQWPAAQNPAVESPCRRIAGRSLDGLNGSDDPRARLSMWKVLALATTFARNSQRWMAENMIVVESVREHLEAFQDYARFGSPITPTTVAAVRSHLAMRIAGVVRGSELSQVIGF